eukprot:1195090-Prorocentrum_minimum.AAC.5
MRTQSGRQNISLRRPHCSACVAASSCLVTCRGPTAPTIKPPSVSSPPILADPPPDKQLKGSSV